MIRPLLPLAWLLVLTLPLLVLCVLQALRPGTRPSAGRTRWWLRAAAVVAVLAIGLGPSAPRRSTEEVGVGVDVFFVVDRTGSMAAEDYAGGAPRLDGVRHDVPALTAAVPGARYSVIAWDSEATRQLPLTSDSHAVESWAQTVRQEPSATSTGSRIDRPLDAVQRALATAAEREPGHLRLLFLLSDGEQTAEGEVASFAELAPLVDGGGVLGYGTPEGGQMHADGGKDYILDVDGTPAVSRIDEAALTTVAEQIGVPYLHRTAPDDALLSLVADVDPQTENRPEARVVTHWNPVVWPAAAVLLALFGTEVWLLVRHWSPTRRRRPVGGAR